MHIEVCYQGTTEINDGNPWYYDIWHYIQDGTFLAFETPKDREALRRMATKYYIKANTLFRRTPIGIELRCVDASEAAEILKETHEGVYGGHINSQFMAKMIIRRGHYWPTMEADCVSKVKRCKSCQLHANKIHASASALHALSAPWPFSMWAFDVVGPIQ